MTAHVSPGVARRLRLLSLGCGLAMPLIAAAACSQNTAPQKVRSHDDPVVIDNSKIKIHRWDPKRHDDTKQSGKKWSLAEMDDFTQIVVMTVDDNNVRHTVGESLSKSESFKIYTAGNANPAFTLGWEAFGAAKHAVVTEGDVAFEHDNGNKKRLAQKGGADLHIVKIEFGNTSICVADDQRPKVNSCDTTPKTPKELHVMICSNEGCLPTEHKEH